MIQLYKLLDEYYDDRQKLALLASESGLSLKDVASGNTLSEFIENIVHEADRQGLADVLNDKIVQRLRVQNGDSYQVGGDQIEVGDIEGDGIAIGEGAQATVHKEYKIRNYYSVRSWRWTDWLVIAALSVPFIIFMAWFLWPFSEMGGDINFAVVDFAEVDASGAVVNNHIGSDISKNFYDGLRKISDQDCPEVLDGLKGIWCRIFQTNKPTLIWHRSLNSLTFSRKQKLARFSRNDSEGQCEEARQLAEDINADVIVYGVFDRRSNEDNKLSLIFYIKDSKLRDLFEKENIFANVDKTTCHSMAATIPLATDQEGRNARRKSIEYQSHIFFKLALGALEYNNGDWKDAIRHFKELDRYFNWSEVQRQEYGIDKIAYLLGRAYLEEYSSQANNNALKMPKWVCNTSSNSQGDHIKISTGEKDLTLLAKAEEAFNIIDIKKDYQHQSEASLGDVWLQIGQLAQLQRGNSESSGTIQMTKQPTSIEEILLDLECSSDNIARVFEDADDHYDTSIDIANNYLTPIPESHYKYFTLTVEYQKNLIVFLKASSHFTKCEQGRDISTCDTAISGLNQFIHNFIVDGLLDGLMREQDNRKLVESYQMMGYAYYWLYLIDKKNHTIEYLYKAQNYLNLCKESKDSFDNQVKRKANECQEDIKEIDEKIANVKINAE